MLKDILLRQVRSCHLLRYDIDTYDRCRDDDPNKSYDFLMRCMRDLIERDRLRKNQERVSKVNASKAPTPKAGAAAAEKKDPKKKSAPKPKDTEEKYCFDFQKVSCTRGANCPCAHRKEPRGRSATRGRPNSPKGNKETSHCVLSLHKVSDKCTRRAVFEGFETREGPEGCRRLRKGQGGPRRPSERFKTFPKPARPASRVSPLSRGFQGFYREPRKVPRLPGFLKN